MSVYVGKEKVICQKVEYCSKSDGLGVYTNFVYAGKPRIIS